MVKLGRSTNTDAEVRATSKLCNPMMVAVHNRLRLMNFIWRIDYCMDERLLTAVQKLINLLSNSSVPIWGHMRHKPLKRQVSSRQAAAPWPGDFVCDPMTFSCELHHVLQINLFFTYRLTWITGASRVVILLYVLMLVFLAILWGIFRSVVWKGSNGVR